VFVTGDAGPITGWRREVDVALGGSRRYLSSQV